MKTYSENGMKASHGTEIDQVNIYIDIPKPRLCSYILVMIRIERIIES
jgi:hypothetical protein